MTARYDSQVPFDWETRKKYLDLPFPTSEYDSRVRMVRRAMEKKGIDALLVFGDAGDPGDLLYLSNFMPFGRAAVLLPLSGQPQVMTDAVLHGEPINSYAWMTWVQDFRAVHNAPGELAQAISSSLAKLRAKNVGLVGKDNMPASVWEPLLSRTRVRWVDFWFEFTSIKSIRSPREIALLREVGRITADAMRAAVEAIDVGKTESEIAAVANYTIASEGGHGGGFPTIVNSGPKSGLKHSYPTARRIARGDMIYLDMGAVRFGYQSDMSRTVVVGGADEQQKEVLDVIEEAFDTLTGMMRPGVRISRLVEKANEIADASGLKEKYRGRIYLGLMVHHAIATSFFEIPSLGLPDIRLKKSMSFAFEPMAHILDLGTAVIEDCLLITSDGSESFTPYEKVHW
ncbi:MAG: Xaa-Pro peptidase family protein [Thaumarchaeota archaeon]|nr:Xaa-Pro peptidase family protein [Nitrososphaerota archaeon]